MYLIGPLIRRRRRALGWTLDVLAAQSGLSKTFLSDLENSKQTISLKNVEKLRSALGLDAAEILGGEPARRPPSVTVRASVSRFQVVQAVRDLINDNESFDHKWWSLGDAETFAAAARLIREGYDDPNPARDRAAGDEAPSEHIA